ncbi:MAG: NIPSNAP family protein [Chitinophagaceae bacterium]|nr:NIPSNAP family protein [Chitinophagaceae bacterium]
MKHPFILSLGLILAAWGTLSFVHQTAQYPNKKKEKEYYQLTIYRFSKQQQEAILDNYFQEALLPALHRLGIKNIGVFKNINNDTSEQKEAYVIIPATSLEKLYALKEKLSTDKAYLQTGNAYINAPASAAPYDRLETILLKSFKLAPTLKIPALKGVRKNRIYELRSYESATEKIFQNKLHMFNEGDEIGLFARLHFNAIFYSEVIAGNKMPNLMYMTSFENMQDRDEHWKLFSADPYWKKLSSLPEYQQNVSHIDIRFLRPVDYSDY